MTKDSILRTFGLGVAASLVLAGCNTESDPLTFKGGPGQKANEEAQYPEGPYGIGVGSIIEDFSFVGFVNSTVNNETYQEVKLSDFFNPNGRTPGYEPPDGQEDDRYFPKDSQYGAGTLKPTVLAIDVASSWCPPCNAQAKDMMPGLHEKYKPCGGEFILQLADGLTPGIAARLKDLKSWTNKYDEDFPAVVDPAYKLAALFEADAFPQNFIVDTTTMKVVEVIAGVPNSIYWKKFEKLLPDPSCPANQ